MPRARRSSNLVELSLAAPQVIAHRMARMAQHGATPNAHDRAELHRMGAEKVVAFNESAQAMWMEAFGAGMRMSMQWWAQWLSPMAWLRAPRLPSAGAMNEMGAAVLAAGVGPFHKRVRANLKRLSAVKRRYGLR
jgi:UDP-N-acetylmuramyl pentapeptide synthase